MVDRLKLVIFDCDGTLADSQHMIVSAMTEAFAARGFAVPEAGAVRSIIGLSVYEAVSRLCPEAGKSDVEALATAFRGAFHARTHYTEPLFDGAEAVIRTLASRHDTVLGIATGKSQRGVKRLLGRYGLEACFVTVQTADDAPSKPHPGMIEQALSETGVGPDDAVMIGDTTYDMEMAANAGVFGLGVDWGYHPREALQDSGAWRIMSHFNELEELLHAVWESGVRHQHEQRRRPRDG